MILPLPLLATVVLAATKVLVRIAPLRSIAPVEYIADGNVFAPLPCRVRLDNLELPPTTAPKVIPAEPALIIRSFAPSTVDVAPLKLIEDPATTPAFVESKVMAALIVTGPV